MNIRVLIHNLLSFSWFIYAYLSLLLSLIVLIVLDRFFYFNSRCLRFVLWSNSCLSIWDYLGLFGIINLGLWAYLTYWPNCTGNLCYLCWLLDSRSYVLFLPPWANNANVLEIYLSNWISLYQISLCSFFSGFDWRPYNLPLTKSYAFSYSVHIKLHCC